MGKKQHSKDRLYLTTKEWKEEFGGFKDRSNIPKSIMPFYYCAISFQPAIDPVCTSDGYVFDLVNAVKYIEKFHKHPITGSFLEVKDLVQLHFHKNQEGQIWCPILNKTFTEYSHIAAVKQTGHVYSYEALDELCIKPKSYRDLITDEAFIKKDIIHLQDPQNLNQRKMASDFDHVKQGLLIDDVEEEEGMENFRNIPDSLREKLQAIRQNNGQTQREEKSQRLQYREMLQQEKNIKNESDQKQQIPKITAPKIQSEQPVDWRLQPPSRESKAQPKFRPGASTWDTEDYITQNQIEAKRDDRHNKKIQKYGQYLGDVEVKGKGKGGDMSGGENGKVNPAEWYKSKIVFKQGMKSTGNLARGFTSTTLNANTKIELEKEQIFFNPTTKAYIRLCTNFGDLNIELHSDVAPRTCENFIYLCQMGYFDNTVFHRSIKNFMLQGGDPTGLGTGGSSIYGASFADEIDSRLVHKERGVLSMANSGRDTNGSQFFVTYKSARHLDYKHSVFGKVVGGFDVLTKMEKVETDKNDRPIQQISIKNCEIFQNPYDDMLNKYLEEEKQKQGKNNNQQQIQKEPGKSYVTVARGVQVEQDQTFGNWYSNPGVTYSNIQQNQEQKQNTYNINNLQKSEQASDQQLLQQQRQGVGKYLQQRQLTQPQQIQNGQNNVQVNRDQDNGIDIPQYIPKKKQKKNNNNQFGNFDKF